MSVILKAPAGNPKQIYFCHFSSSEKQYDLAFNIVKLEGIHSFKCTIASNLCICTKVVFPFSKSLCTLIDSVATIKSAI